LQQLTHDLETANREIVQLNEHLEQLVQQRTAELDRAYHTLQKLDQTKSNFIQVAAHELRTPLTLIKGYTQLLNDLVHDAPIRDLLSGILAGQDRLHEMINSLLDVSRIASEVLHVQLEPTPLINVIRNVCGGFDAALQERHLTLTLTGLVDLPPIEADPAMMQKLFYHLIGNALKYTPDGGAITISGQLITVTEKCPIVEVIVQDTGIGIDPADHALIFEKFYQVGKVELHSSGRTKFKGGGPGLGLSIAKGIVQAHGGEIWVESPGHDESTCPGSQFHICLPVHSLLSPAPPTKQTDVVK
jgi:signal transduction histidine kinase